MEKSKKVIAVCVAEASQLEGTKRIGRNVVRDVPSDVWTQLDIKVPADLTLSSKVEDKVTLHTAKLVFSSCSAKDENFHIPVYKVKLANGIWLLIGCNERPYPVRTYEQNYSSGNSDSQLREVTVALTDIYEPPIIIES